jgi:hypothetical protein
MFCSSNNRCSQATSEVDHTPTENMVIDTPELDSKSDAFMSKQKKKVKRKHRRKKLYYETEGMRSMFFYWKLLLQHVCLLQYVAILMNL